MEVPEIALSTDMIVGFPGETSEDFEDTLSLTRLVRFRSMFSFKYSERPNTLAAKRLKDDIPESEKGRRLTALQDLQREIQLELNRATVGKTVDVLVDAQSRRRPEELAGRTGGNSVVNLPGRPEWLGSTVSVAIKRAGANSLWGEATSVVEPSNPLKQPGIEPCGATS
jgi:tRNA-2-methylthio-N6-dimethylallyladenosine synthase